MKNRIGILVFKVIFIIMIVMLALFCVLAFNRDWYEAIFGGNEARDEKPVIMLYPEETTEVFVRLKTDAKMLTTYPEYKSGWRVTAHPDGRLEMDGRSYRCLFWEAEGGFAPDFSTGFVIKGEDTAEFLENKLTEIGLNEDEADDFIIYWLPRMENNAYNLISFQTENYQSAYELEITPAPDSLLRVFMAFKGLDEPIELPPQEFEPFERHGFAAVEWGGREVK